MIRFFADKSDITESMIQLDSEDAAHIRSLRLRPSEFFIVCDGEGTDYVCRLGGGGAMRRRGERKEERGETKDEGEANAEIVEARPSLGEPTIKCSAYIALAKGDRLDYAVQKSVELGAYEIILFSSERCVAQPGDMTKKTARLQRIALETAKQCGRGRVPEVSAVSAFGIAVENASKADMPLSPFMPFKESRKSCSLP